MPKIKSMINSSTLIQDFFCNRLITQRNASAETIASYRDTFRLLFRYTQEQIKKALKKIQDPSFKSVRYQASDTVLAFLESL